MKRQLEPPKNPIKKKKLCLKRSELDKEIDKDLFTEITTKGEEILPVSITKYTGSIQELNNRWKSRLPRGYKEYTYDTKEEAANYIKRLNIKRRWPITNIIYKYDDEYYCVLTRKQLMKFSIENRDLVEAYTWSANYDGTSNTFYACSTINGRSIRFHALVLPNDDKTKTTDHTNRITLDNTPSNLRIVSRRIQAINKRLLSTNKTGFRGVSYVKKRHCYKVDWINEQGEKDHETFSMRRFGEKTLEVAVAFYKKTTEGIEHYRIADAYVNQQ